MLSVQKLTFEGMLHCRQGWMVDRGRAIDLEALSTSAGAKRNLEDPANEAGPTVSAYT